MCSRCAWPKPATTAYFPLFPRGRHGVGSWCHDCHADYDRSRRQENKQEQDDRSRRYARANPEAKRAAAQKRRDLISASPTRLTPDQEATLRSYFGECVGCGATDDLSLDHVYPLALGGTDGPENRQLLCARCNRRKKNRAKDYRATWRRTRAAAGDDPGPPPFPWTSCPSPSATSSPSRSPSP